MVKDYRGQVGVGGWLLVLVIGLLAIRPLLLAKDLLIASGYESMHPALAGEPQWIALRNASRTAGVLVISLSVLAGLMLIKRRKRDAVTWAVFAIWSAPVADILLLLYFFNALRQLPAFPEAILQYAFLLIFSITGCALWHAYLLKSKRVAATYYANVALQVVPAAASPVQRATDVGLESPGTAIPSAETNQLDHRILPADDLNEGQLYDEIAKELDSGIMDKGLWTRAYAEAEGDDRGTKVIYIRRRFAQLKARRDAEGTERTSPTPGPRRIEGRVPATLRSPISFERVPQSSIAQKLIERGFGFLAERLLSSLGGQLETSETGFFVRRLSATFENKSTEPMSDIHFLRWMREEIAPQFAPSKDIVTLSSGNLAKQFFAAIGKADSRRVTQLLQQQPMLIAAYDRDQAYGSPLHVAVATGNSDIVSLLLARGVQVNLLNAEGKTATDLARERGLLEIEKQLSIRQ